LLAATIADLTLAATATDPGSAVLAATIADLTLAATATDPGSALLAATIADLTLAATATVTDSAALAATIADLTLAATATVTDSAALAATIADLTSAATATVTDSAALAATIADLTLAATATVTDSAALDATIGPITLVATDQDVISAAVDATIGALILSATSVVGSSGDAVGAWWWQEYVARHEAERRAPRLADLWGFPPMPSAAAEGEHIAPRGLDAVIPAPLAFGTGVRGIAGAVAARGVNTISGRIRADVGAQGAYAVAEIRPAGFARGLVRVDGNAAARVVVAIAARLDHARRADLRLGLSGPILAAARGELGVAARAECRIEIRAAGHANAGRAAAMTARLPAMICAASASIVRAGAVHLALVPHAAAAAEHDPDDEEALTCALLLAA